MTMGKARRVKEELTAPIHTGSLLVGMLAGGFCVWVLRDKLSEWFGLKARARVWIPPSSRVMRAPIRARPIRRPVSARTMPTQKFEGLFI